MNTQQACLATPSLATTSALRSRPGFGPGRCWLAGQPQDCRGDCLCLVRGAARPLAAQICSPA